jgi:hypothetical protein
MKSIVLWDVTLCGYGQNRRFGKKTNGLHHQIVFLRSGLQVLGTANVLRS